MQRLKWFWFPHLLTIELMCVLPLIVWSRYFETVPYLAAIFISCIISSNYWEGYYKRKREEFNGKEAES